MRVERLGDRAYLLRELPAPAYQVAEHLNRSRLPHLEEAVAGYDAVGLYVTSGFEPACLTDIVPGPDEAPRRHEIPVWYEAGLELQQVCADLGLSVAEFVSLHSGTDYVCAAIGFCPGFPYLRKLPERIRGLPRRDSPRTRVDPGAVAITGDQTGIYPLQRPGGWNIIGVTPLTIVDVGEKYFPIQAGDTVRFTPIDGAEFARLKGQRL